jgi:hypothetical protein
VPIGFERPIEYVGNKEISNRMTIWQQIKKAAALRVWMLYVCSSAFADLLL